MKAPYIRNVDGGIVAIHAAGGSFLGLNPTFHVAEGSPRLRAKASHPDLRENCFGTGNTGVEAIQALVNELYYQLPDAK